MIKAIHTVYLALLAILTGFCAFAFLLHGGAWMAYTLGVLSIIGALYCVWELIRLYRPITWRMVAALICYAIAAERLLTIRAEDSISHASEHAVAACLMLVLAYWITEAKVTRTRKRG